MQFELTEALIDNILFAMEDQEGEFYVDTRKGFVAGGIDFDFTDEDDDEEEDDDDGRYISIPEWDSSEGFRLMEHFAAEFKNPPVQQELIAALNRGRGVFRAFKDALNAHPEAEKLWFAFKEREMRRAVFDWYNALREEWGMEAVGGEPEETEDLVLEDFRFREPGEEDYGAAEELHRRCTGDEESEGWAFPGDAALVAETGGGVFAAYISAVLRGKLLRIAALEVKPEYRGLGVGKSLLSRLLEKTNPPGSTEIEIDLPAGMEGFSRALSRESFTPCMVRYRKKIGGACEN
jgi:GNAT superfamily N-acetyltransferase